MPQAPICDYEDSDYRTRFWENQGREYEDAVERIAIRRLLTASGGLVMDLGAGYGRLADLYAHYRRVVLFDYSRSQLSHARSRLGDGRFVYVAGDMYRLPFVPGLFDAVTQVRVIHHAADVPAAFEQVRRAMRPDGAFLLEFANKHNLKAVIRYLVRRQQWSPFSHEPVEFVELNFDFHPAWIRDRLTAAGFLPGRMLSVSHFRIGFLKRRLPIRWLVALDSLAQHTGRWFQLAPSVFVLSRATSSGPVAPDGAFFACPCCRASLPAQPAWLEGMPPADDQLICGGCGRFWPIQDGIYDFKGT